VTDRCAVLRCRGEVEIVYLGHGVCSHHWNELADDDSFSRLRMVLGIETASTAMEVAMDETTTAAENAAEEATVPTKSKATKKTKTSKAKAKPAKAAKPKKERPPKEPLPGRVFAIRVTDAELEAIHRASGPRNATRFVRAVAAAFAQENVEAFKAVVAEARKLR